MSSTDNAPSAYTPRYSSINEIPVGGPDSPLGPNVSDDPSVDSSFSLPSDARVSEGQKRAALHWAEGRVDRRINGGDPLADPVPSDVVDAVNCYATYWLLVPSIHIASAFRGESDDSGDVRLEIAREYKQQGDDIIADLDEDPGVSGDEDTDRTHGGSVRTVTPGSKREPQRSELSEYPYR